MLLDLFRKAGVSLGLGTDSVVSVGELDLWAEAEAAGFTGDAAIRALTMDGARALAWEPKPSRESSTEHGVTVTV